jgi:hypothetical protein
MAQKIAAYVDDAGTKYGYSIEESLIDLWVDFAAAAGLTLAAPFNTTYADLAALQAVGGWSGAIAAPAGLSFRKQTLGLSESTGQQIASVQVPVGDVTHYDALEPTGATPFPTTAYTLTALQASIVGVSGEQRSGN